MHARTHVATSSTPVFISNALGGLAALVLLAALTGFNTLVAGNDALVFMALAIIGFSMCAIGGIGRAPAKLGWLHPATLTGAVLGAAILLLIVANAFGWTATLEPLAVAIGVSVQRAAVLMLALLLALKWAIGLAFVR